MITIDGRPIFTGYVRIENRAQFLTTVPRLHPDDPRYNIFWSKEFKKCIEGVWGEMFGKYRFCPGFLYYYANYFLLEDTDENKQTRYIRPNIDDIEWEIAYMSLEAHGFSGWLKDDKYTSLELVKDLELQGIEDPTPLIMSRFPECIAPNGKLKKYISARENIRKLHDEPLGRPWMKNETHNEDIMGTRGGGKSYITAGELEHGLIFDGATAYNKEFLQNRLVSQYCVGSGEADKSSELVSKIVASINAKADPVLGEQFGVWVEKNGDKTITTPCPFYKDMKGDTAPPNKSNPYRYEYKEEHNGRWVTKTGSKLNHVNYSSKKGNGAQAAAGGRYRKSVVEEVGLCFAKDTQIRMHDGSTKYVQDVVVGDIVMGIDGTPRTVTELSYGIDQMYKISQTFGDDYVVNSKHELVLFERFKNSNSIHYIKPEDFLSWNKSRRKETYGIKNPCLYFSKADLPIDPYYLGLWLGDGTKSSTSITSCDIEVKDFLEEYSKRLKLRFSCYTDKRHSNVKLYNIVVPKGQKNPLRQALSGLGLMGKSKSIPSQYIFSNQYQRLELLAGLIDTDGNIGNKGKSSQYYEINVSRNKKLVDDIEWLVLSLGFRCKVTEKISDKGFGNKIIDSRIKYRIRISGEIWNIPCKIERKKAPFITHLKNHLCTSVFVESIGEGEYYGFNLLEDPLFLLKDGTIVHNTENAVDIHTSNDSTIARDGRRFGVERYMGTSGNLNYVQSAKKLFTNPFDYRIVAYRNEHGQEGQKGEDGQPYIGFFLPYYMVLRQYKDKDGNTDYALAAAHVQKIRDQKKKSGDPSVLREHKMNHPCFVEEMWISPKGFLLPYEEAQLRERQLLSFEMYKTLETCVNLTWDSTAPNGVSYNILHDGEPYRDFPIEMSKRKNPQGCIVIYDFPKTVNGHTPYDMYMFVGHDPYVEEDIERGGSIGSTYILMNPKYIPLGYNGNTVVASYIDKPLGGLDEYYENQEKLLAFYGNPPQGLCFEKNRGQDCRAHYIRKNKTYLLMPTPQHTQGTSIYQRNITSYGYNVGNKLVKLQLIKQLNDWLLEETTLNDGTKKNIERIPCLYLIRQIMQYNLEDNFDAVDGFRGCVIALKDYESRMMNEKHVKEASTSRKDYARILNNPRIFKNAAKYN